MVGVLFYKVKNYFFLLVSAAAVLSVVVLTSAIGGADFLRFSGFSSLSGLSILSDFSSLSDFLVFSFLKKECNKSIVVLFCSFLAFGSVTIPFCSRAVGGGL